MIEAIFDATSAAVVSYARLSSASVTPTLPLHLSFVFDDCPCARLVALEENHLSRYHSGFLAGLPFAS